MNRQDIIDHLAALAALVEEAQEMVASLPSGGQVADGKVANEMSSAHTPHEWEADDPLPNGRLKHAPYDHKTPEEKRRIALDVLCDQVHFIAPLFWAEQHYQSTPARRYFRGLLQEQFRELYNEGLVERRNIAKRGARYGYRLNAQGRALANREARAA